MITPKINKRLNLVEHIFSPHPAKGATRNGFGDGLLFLGMNNKNIVALTADLGGSVRQDKFKEAFPKRFFEIGVAEQNLAALASGMAHMGKIPFIGSFAVFSPGRNWEQIRTTICINQANVKIIGSHAGVLTGEDGATHQALEDIAITRALPNMTVIVPCDAKQAEKATVAVSKTKNPTYLRVERAKRPIFTTDKTPFEIGKAQVLTEGKDIAIIACGHMVYRALVAYEELLGMKINAKIINCHTIKPIDKQTIIRAAKDCGSIITIEDHNIIGGLGSAVAEVLGENYPVKLKRMGLESFGESGKSQELMKRFKLRSTDIVKQAKKMVKR